jgi:hypothetical protein
MKTMDVNVDFLTKLGSSDMESWILVQRAFVDNAWGEEIMDCGFNTNTGYVYIALENCVTIASCFGQSIDYIVTNYEDGEESFYDTYEDALNSIK